MNPKLKLFFTVFFITIAAIGAMWGWMVLHPLPQVIG